MLEQVRVASLLSNVQAAERVNVSALVAWHTPRSALAQNDTERALQQENTFYSKRTHSIPRRQNDTERARARVCVTYT